MNKRFLSVFVLLLAAISAVALWRQSVTDQNQHSAQENTLSDTLSAKDDEFEKVMRPRPFIFPADHGPHNEYRTEWWYFTGNVQEPSGRKFGYELTFFRYALTREKQKSSSNWRSNQMYMAHFALTDVANDRFYADERFSRAANGLAGSLSDRYRVWLYDWSAEMEKAEDSPIHLTAQTDAFAIDLKLELKKPAMFQGDKGFSQKSSEPGNASYYYSYTRLKTSGTLRVQNRSFSVSGTSWMDREWSTSALSSEQTGWDWFALQFSDQTELMYYQLRRKDGKPDSHSSGALFLADYSKIPLTNQEVLVANLDYWKSPHTGITYPSRWRLSIPSLQTELEVIPLINDQELNVTYRYWEGAVSVSGIKNGQPIKGRGYVELAGYSAD